MNSTFTFCLIIAGSSVLLAAIIGAAYGTVRSFGFFMPTLRYYKARARFAVRGSGVYVTCSRPAYIRSSVVLKRRRDGFYVPHTEHVHTYR